MSRARLTTAGRYLPDVEAGPMPCRSAYGHWNDPVCAAAYQRAWAHWRAIRRDGRMTPAEVDHRLGVLAELHEQRVATSTLAAGP